MSDTGLKPKAKVDGRHELVERVDDRGAGEVWKVRDPDFKTRLSMLKVLAPVEGGAPAALAELARRMRSIKHPALLPMTGVGMSGERPYVSLAWFDGVSLAAACAEGALSLDALAKAFDAVCEAVEACHVAGVAHGGINPGCVLVHRAGDAVEARLVDVGLARWADLGTAFLYADCVAPELREGHSLSPAADVFSLGATLRRALAAGRDDTMWCEPSAQYRGRCDAPAAVWSVVERAVQHEAGARYETVSALRGALAAAWRDDARLPVQRAEADTLSERRDAPAESPAPPSLWATNPPRAAASAVDDDDVRKTTMKLPSLPGAPAGSSAPLSLESMLQSARASTEASLPPVTRDEVPTGAQNPWSTDVLRREVSVALPGAAAEPNPWSTDVMRREVKVDFAQAGAPQASSPMSVDDLIQATIQRDRAAAPAPVAVSVAPVVMPSPVERTERARADQMAAAVGVPVAPTPAAPRSRTGLIVAVVVVVACALAAVVAWAAMRG